VVRETIETIRCGKCNTTLATVQNACLVIVQRHHGERHINVIPLADIVKLAAEQQPARECLKVG